MPMPSASAGRRRRAQGSADAEMVGREARKIAPVLTGQRQQRCELGAGSETGLHVTQPVSGGLAPACPQGASPTGPGAASGGVSVLQVRTRPGCACSSFALHVSGVLM